MLLQESHFSRFVWTSNILYACIWSWKKSISCHCLYVHI